MLNRIMNINKRVVLGILGSGFALVFIGHGCSDMQGAKGGKSASIGSCGTDGSEKIEIIAGSETTSIVYGRQVLDNMVACTGVGEPSATTLAEWENRSASLSEYGFANQVSAPMMMGIAAVAGEVCNDLVLKESRTVNSDDRFFFKNVDLDGNSMSRADLEDAVDLIGISCWQRNPSSDEIAEIVDSVDDMQVDNELAAISACTAMLSSLSGVNM